MSATILLVRHGSHDELGRVLSGRSEIALNSVGKAQAERLAARLRHEAIAKIFTSPRRRARETASIVANGCAVTPVAVDALDEIDFGDWSGRSFADLEADEQWRLWNEDRGRARTLGGETMADATSRARRHVEACAEDGVVLCVSHCDIIRGLVTHYRNLGADRLLSFDIAPASVTTLRVSDGVVEVVAVNEIAS